MPAGLEDVFPNLLATGYQITSPKDRRYNCIAWAAGENSAWWWPSIDAYWPAGVPVEETLDAFVAAYQTLGYVAITDGQLEDGFEKIAIYAKNNKPAHTARQLESGEWTSKCGQSFDISHAIDGVRGTHYGDPVVFMKRPR